MYGGYGWKNIGWVFLGRGGGCGVGCGWGVGKGVGGVEKKKLKFVLIKN